MFENVIVIGCDKTGKSTLIDSLLQAPEIKGTFRYYKGEKCATPEDAVAKAQQVMLERDVHGDPMIFDRFHFPDDFVYHPVFTGNLLPKTVVSRYFRWVFPGLKKRKTLFIYCFASPELVADRFINEKEALIPVEKIRDIMDNYIEVLGFLKEHFPILVLNSEYMSKGQMFDLAYRAIKEEPRQ
ncbi:hypothetical protein [Weizmannia phage Youna2]